MEAGGENAVPIRRAPAPAVAMLVGSIASVQCGAALATTLFDRVGPGGAVLLRTGFAALILLAVAGRELRPLQPAAMREVVIFAVVLAGMNFSFYSAIDRLPLGVAVTLEFVGPLAVAVFGSRRRADLIWAALAAVGIVLLSGGFGGASINLGGALFALLAGGFWGLYILISARVGGRSEGLGGLALALSISTLLLLPAGIVQGGGDLLHPAVLAAGLGVGLLASAIPYAVELEALRRLPNAVFGVLMSLEPAAAALVGLLALSQSLSATEVVAIALVVIASAGALRSAATPAPRDG